MSDVLFAVVAILIGAVCFLVTFLLTTWLIQRSRWYQRYCRWVRHKHERRRSGGEHPDVQTGRRF